MTTWGYKFTVEAERERFMEPTLHDKFEEIVLANSYEEAHSHIWSRLERAGWKINSMKGGQIAITDIRQ